MNKKVKLFQFHFQAQFKILIHIPFPTFGNLQDGATSQLPNPIHDYIIEDDYTIQCCFIVEDETGQRDWSSETIEIDQGNTSFPITMNFVGDIMMAGDLRTSRWTAPNQGVEALFEPTIELLGNGFRSNLLLI